MDDGIIVLIVLLIACFGALIGYNFPIRYQNDTVSHDSLHLLSVVSGAVLLPVFLVVRGCYIPLRNDDGDAKLAETFLWILFFFPYYLMHAETPVQEVGAVDLTSAGDVCCPCIPSLCQVDDLYETVKAKRRPKKSFVNSYDSFVNRSLNV